MNYVEVANVIKSQIYAGGINKVWSWGANSFSCGQMPKEEKGGGESFLMFKVQGFIFKGLVRVILEWNDTYKVQLLKREKGELVVKDEVSNVYFDELTDIIDRKVEYCGDDKKYTEQVKNTEYKF